MADDAIPDWAAAPQPTGDTPDWAKPPQQADTSGDNSGAAPAWAQEEPEEPDEGAPKTSMAGAALSGAIRGIGPTIGAVALGGAGALGGGLVGGPIGAIAGGLAGAVAGGDLGARAQQSLTDATGLGEGEGVGSNTYAAAAEKDYPYTTMLSGLAPALVAFGTGAGEATLGMRVLTGGLMGSMEAGQELYNEGTVDPGKVALAAGFGAAVPKARGWLEGTQNAVLGKITGRPTTPAPPDVMADRDAVKGVGQQFSSGVGTSHSQTADTNTPTGGHPAADQTGAGYVGVGSEVDYPKSSTEASYSDLPKTPSTVVDTGDHPPLDVSAALRGNPDEEAVGVGAQPGLIGGTPEETPAQPAPQPVQPVQPVTPTPAPASAPAQAGPPVVHGVPLDVEPHVAAIINLPKVKAAIENGVTDTGHVPAIAGSSAGEDTHTHVDSSLPKEVPLGNKRFEPAKAMQIHEQVEKFVMEYLQSKDFSDKDAYTIAHHDFAEPAEDAYYRALGIDPKQAEAWWAGPAKRMVEANKNRTVSDNLYDKPYLDNPADHHAADNVPEPSAALRAKAAEVMGLPPDALAKAQSEEAKPVTAAVTELPRAAKLAAGRLRDLGFEDKAAALEKMAPDEAARAAEKINHQFTNKALNRKYENPQVKARAEGSLAAVKKAYEEHPAEPDEDDQSLLDRAKAAVATAKEAYGDKNPTDKKEGFAPAVKPKEWTFVKRAQDLLARPTDENIEAFRGDEAQDWAGAQETHRIKADVERQRRTDVDTLANELPAKPSEGRVTFPDVDVSKGDALSEDRQALHEYLNGIGDADYSRLQELYRDPANPDAQSLQRVVETTTDPHKLLTQMESELDTTGPDLVSPEEAPVAKREKVFAGKPVGESAGAANTGRSRGDLLAEYNARLRSGNLNPKPHPLSADATPAQRASLASHLKDAWGKLKDAEFWYENPVRKIFSPQTVTVNAQEAANQARDTHGERLRFDAQNAKLLENFQKVANTTDKKGVMDWLMNFEKDAVPSGNPFNAVQADLKAFTDRVWDKVAKLHLGDQTNFVDNYFPRSKMWAQDDANQSAIRNFMTQQGSISPLKAREFLTIPNALAAGVKFNPDILRPDGAPDPAKVLGYYKNQTGGFLENQDMLQRFVKAGIAHVYDFTADEAPIPGTVKLEGRTLRGLPVYAEPEVATIFNNFWGPGIHANEAAGQLYDIWMHGKTSMSSLKLLGGGYHLVAEAGESIILNFGVGLSQMASGRVAEGLKTIAKSPASPVSGYTLGKKGGETYLDPRKNPDLTLYVGAFQDAGITMAPNELIHENPELRAAESNFFTSFKRGALGLEADEAKQRIRAAADKNFALGGAQVGKEVFNLIGKSMQTVMYPLFQHYIPNLKNGIMIQHMAAWDNAHPGAHYDDMVAAARQIGDQTDNALGMIHQSNVFWNKTLKQGAQASMLSWGWNFGSARGIVGGALKLLRNPSSVSITSKDWDPRSAYVLAMPIMTAVMASIYQLLKTGKMPEDPPNGLGEAMTAKTGGNAARSGEPERALLPGYQKDILGVWNNVLNPSGTGKPTTELYNKLAPAVQLGIESMTNQDWAGHPIWNPDHPMTQKLLEYFRHVGQSLMPIAVEQAEQLNAGTNISVPERLIGVRPAPSWVEKPNQTQTWLHKKNEKDWKEKEKFDSRMMQ